MDSGKVCNKCGEFKDFSFFGKQKYGKFGHRAVCNPCRGIEYAENLEENRAKLRRSRELHGEKWDAARRKKYKEDAAYREIALSKSKKYYSYNKAKKADYDKRYAKSENGKARAKRKYQRIKNNPNLYLDKRLRDSFRTSLKRASVAKKGSALKYLGCTMPEFQIYITSLFTERMSWDKILSGEIHIDHIKPCCSFDFTKEEQIAECFHYTNLRPLWESDNCRKGATEDKKLSIYSKSHNNLIPV